MIGTPITDGNRTYQPVSEETARQTEANVKISSAAARALEYFSIAPSPQEVLAAFFPVHVAAARKQIDRAEEWIAEFSKLLKGA
jgi:hypothetical protein